MYEYEWNSMPYMQMMGMADCCYPMMTMPQQQLESMYPRVYFIVFPVVMRHCDMMDMKYGLMHIPTCEQLDSMADNIVSMVSPDVEKAIAEGAMEEERQLGFGGRRLLRDLVLILLLRELIRRRGQRWGYNGYPTGIYGTYGGYPGGFPMY